MKNLKVKPCNNCMETFAHLVGEEYCCVGCGITVPKRKHIKKDEVVTADEVKTLPLFGFRNA